MSTQLDALTSKITDLEAKIGTTVEKSQEAILLLNRLSAEIQTLKEDPAAVDGLASRMANIAGTLQASNDALSEAVSANAPKP